MDMKKTLLTLILILATLLSFASCGEIPEQELPDDTSGNSSENTLDNTLGSTSDSTVESDTEQPSGEKTVYELLESLTRERYQKISLTVCTVTGNIELGAEYVLSDNLVTYRIEQLNMLPTDGNFEDISSDYKVTVSGNAEIRDGQVIKLDQSTVSLPSCDTLVGSFNFDKSNFQNVEERSSDLSTFQADVVAPEKFLGTPTDATDMKVVVEYSQASLEAMTMVYSTANARVTIVYAFEK